MAYQPVAHIYNGKSVFITGTTGFLGKVLLEKLLYSCPGLDKAYVLVRGKKNMNAAQRLETILEQAIFSRLKEEKPEALKKIVPIIGDITEPNLGIEPEDEQLLINSVSFVFHVAATVKFTEPLESAMNINVAGTGRVLNLCRCMKNIQLIFFFFISVASSESEPIPGWLDNWFGASALITFISKGLNRVVLASPTNNLDLIPVDYVSNLIIVAAAKCNSSKEVLVYNSATSAENPINGTKLMAIVREDSVKHKFNDFPMPTVYYTKSRWLAFLITLFLQIIPSYIADFFLRITGKEPKFMKMQTKVLLVRESLEFFTYNNWEIRASNSRALANSLSKSDRVTFPCDPAAIDWEKFLPIYCHGIRKFLCKTT